ncbi:uncharacterized protein LOC143028006 [Oratosquilla oratoria]|uniref:uncharacterized protein LOC143028006 n=1 Tax=Oratosquilla oratoria TaxID=337810 RepID=UPI003F7780A7
MVDTVRTLSSPTYSSSSSSSSSPTAMAQAVAAVMVAAFTLFEPANGVSVHRPIPDISLAVEKTRYESGANAILNIWEHSLQLDREALGTNKQLRIEPKTILSPNAIEVLNLAPQDAPNPLYSDVDLRRDFLFDHLVLLPVDPKNESLARPGGLTMNAISGRELVFKRGKTGDLTVNDVPVEKVTPLEDGTFVYVPATVLFDHKEKVQVAFRQLAGIPFDLEKELENIGPPLDLSLGEPLDLGEPLGPPATFHVPGTFPPGSNVPLPPAIPEFANVRPPAPPRLAPGVVASPLPVGPPSPPRTRTSPIAFPGNTGNPPSSSSFTSSFSSSSSSSSSSSVIQQPRGPDHELTNPSNPSGSPAHSARGGQRRRRQLFGPSFTFALSDLSSSLSNQGLEDERQRQRPQGEEGSRKTNGEAFSSTISASSSTSSFGQPSSGGSASSFSSSSSFAASASASSSASSTSSASFSSPLDFVDLNFFAQPGGQSSSLDAMASSSRATLRRDNRPVEALTSIDQFATLWQLAHEDTDRRRGEAPSVVTVLQERGLSSFLALLETSGLLQRLVTGEGGPYIVLVPSEAAFSRLPREELIELTRTQENLSYHLIPMEGAPLPDLGSDSIFTSSSGVVLRVSVIDGRTYVNGFRVSDEDLVFSHGVIKVIDAVLKPPPGDVREVLVSAMEPLTRITTLLTINAIMEEGPVTLMAPLDSAITSKGYSWPRILMDRLHGLALLRHHTFRGFRYTKDLVREGVVSTLAGTNVTFRTDKRTGEITANGVPLLRMNLTATDGVVHIPADLIPEQDLDVNRPSSFPAPFLHRDGTLPFTLNQGSFLDSIEAPQNPILPPGIQQGTTRPEDITEDPLKEPGLSIGLPGDTETFLFLSPGSSLPGQPESLQLPTKPQAELLSPQTPSGDQTQHPRGPFDVEKDITEDDPKESLLPMFPGIVDIQAPPPGLDILYAPPSRESPRPTPTSPPSREIPRPSHTSPPSREILRQSPTPPPSPELAAYFGIFKTPHGEPSQGDGTSGVSRVTNDRLVAKTGSNVKAVGVGNPTQLVPCNSSALISPDPSSESEEQEEVFDILGTGGFLGTDPWATSSQGAVVQPQGSQGQRPRPDFHFGVQDHSDGPEVASLTKGVPGTGSPDGQVNFGVKDSSGQSRQEPFLSAPPVNSRPPTHSLGPPETLRTQMVGSRVKITSENPSLSSGVLGDPSDPLLPGVFIATVVPPTSRVPQKRVVPQNLDIPRVPKPSNVPRVPSIPVVPVVTEGPLKVPVVPGNVEIFTHPPGLSPEEKSRLNVMTLLRRLNLTNFAELLDMSGLSTVLKDKGPWTVIAPSNNAIATLPREALEQILSHLSFLRRLLSYHVVPSAVPSKDFTPGKRLTTLHAGHALTIDHYTQGQQSTWAAGGSLLSNLDEVGSNGVIHVADRLLYAPYGHMVDTIRQSPVLQIFSQILLGDPFLHAFVASVGPMTVFVPSDAVLEQLELPTHPALLRDWVLSHVVEGTWYTVGFSNTWPLVSINNDTITTMFGPPVADVENTSEGEEAAGLFWANGAPIVYPDITTTNGVLHVIDALLIQPPPSPSSSPTPSSSPLPSSSLTTSPSPSQTSLPSSPSPSLPSFPSLSFPSIRNPSSSSSSSPSSSSSSPRQPSLHPPSPLSSSSLTPKTSHSLFSSSSSSSIASLRKPTLYQSLPVKQPTVNHSVRE